MSAERVEDEELADILNGSADAATETLAGEMMGVRDPEGDGDGWPEYLELAQTIVERERKMAAELWALRAPSDFPDTAAPDSERRAAVWWRDRTARLETICGAVADALGAPRGSDYSHLPDAAKALRAPVDADANKTITDARTLLRHRAALRDDQLEAVVNVIVMLVTPHVEHAARLQREAEELRGELRTRDAWEAIARADLKQRAAELDTARAEIERLRLQIHEDREAHRRAQEQKDAEIERLKDGNDAWTRLAMARARS